MTLISLQILQSRLNFHRLHATWMAWRFVVKSHEAGKINNLFRVRGDSTARFPLRSLLARVNRPFSWASLEPFSVILSGGQPKMYWWLYCTGASKSHEIAHICCQTQGQHIQWKFFSVWWQCIDLELTPSEIYALAHWLRHSVNIYIELCFRKIHKKSFPDINQACF